MASQRAVDAEGPLAADLPPAAADALRRAARSRRVRRGETVVWEGHEAEICGTVLSGVLKLSKGTEDGREAIVGLVFPGDFFGRPYGVRAGFSLAAAVDAELCIYPRAAFEEAMREHRSIEHELYLRALADIDNMRGWMLVLGRQQAGERIASFLLHVARRLGPDGWFDLPLTRAEIGDVLGVTIGTVSRELSALREAGLIELAGARGVRILGWRVMAGRTGLPGAFG